MSTVKTEDLPGTSGGLDDSEKVMSSDSANVTTRSTLAGLLPSSRPARFGPLDMALKWGKGNSDFKLNIIYKNNNNKKLNNTVLTITIETLMIRKH